LRVDGINRCLARLLEFPTHTRQAFPFIDEILNLARTIAERPVAHADHGKEWVFSRGMIPNPILGHVQSSRDIFRSKEWIELLVVFNRLIRMRPMTGALEKVQFKLAGEFDMIDTYLNSGRQRPFLCFLRE
jgi:hypothetical protein